MEITKTQRALMEHTISGPNRNWFGTCFNCADNKEFKKLVDAGLATCPNCNNKIHDTVIKKWKKALKSRRYNGEFVVNCQECDTRLEVVAQMFFFPERREADVNFCVA